MFFFKTSRIAHTWYQGKVLCRVGTPEKKLFLTFDDGPIPEVTLPVLEILSSFQIKATFFCVGENVFHHYPVYQEIIKQGHQTGNHTYNHLKGWKTQTPAYLENVERCGELVHSRLFRPPYGKIRKSQLEALRDHYQVVLWSVLSYDFHAASSVESCLEHCINNMQEGNIYVFHDSLKARDKVLSLLPRFIEGALSRGFQFEALTPTV